MPTSIRAGVVGLGRGAVLAELLQDHPHVGHVATFDPDPHRASTAAGVPQPSLDGLLAANLDLVVIASPPPLHLEHSLRALRTGAFVLCETPAIRSLDDALALAQAPGWPQRFALAEDYLWTGWVRDAKRLVAQGALGQVHSAAAQYREDARPLFADDQPVTWRDRFPPMHYLSHTLGPLLHILDDYVVDVVAFSVGGLYRPQRVPHDHQMAIMRTAGSRLIQVASGFAAAFPYGYLLELVGTQGSLRLQRHATESALAFTAADDTWQVRATDYLGEKGGRTKTAKMIDHFVGVVRGDHLAAYDGRRSLQMVLPGIAAQISIDCGGIQPVPDAPGLA